jgi:hypothetical protein
MDWAARHMRHYTDDELTLYHYGEAPHRDRIDEHLQSCEPCAAIYQQVAGTLALVGDLDVPERDDRYGLEVWQRIRHDLPSQELLWGVGWWTWRVPVLVGTVAVLVMAAFVAGRFWPRAAPPRQEGIQAANLAEVRGELREMREMLMLSLMQQQSATERLRGVSGSVAIDRPGAEIVRALLETLMHDPNVNVRLACVDALKRFSEQEVVRDGTIQALRQTPYPLVQIALIDFVVETKDRNAIDALRLLSQDPEADEAVRGRAAWGIEQLNL